MDDFDLELEFLGEADQGNHDLRVDFDAGFLDVSGGFEDRPGLHLADLGISDAEAATAVAEHGIELMEVADALGNFVDADVKFFGELGLRGVVVGKEFVQRRIEKTDRRGQSLEGLENAGEILADRKSTRLNSSHGYI